MQFRRALLYRSHTSPMYTEYIPTQSMHVEEFYLLQPSPTPVEFQPKNPTWPVGPSRLAALKDCSPRKTNDCFAWYIPSRCMFAAFLGGGKVACWGGEVSWGRPSLAPTWNAITPSVCCTNGRKSGSKKLLGFVLYACLHSCGKCRYTYRRVFVASHSHTYTYKHKHTPLQNKLPVVSSWLELCDCLHCWFLVNSYGNLGIT